MDVNETNYNAALASQISAPEAEPTEQDANQLTTPQIVDAEIRDMILKRKEASRAFFQAKKEIWDQCWNDYKQIYDTTNKESWQSTTFIPLSPKIAEVITSNMHSALLAPDRPVEYQPKLPEFEVQVRDANDLIAADMEAGQFKIHANDILRSMCVIGTGIGKIEYRKEYADVTVKERNVELPMMAMARRMLGLAEAPQETTSIKRMVVQDFATCEYRDRYDIYPEPGTVDFCKDKWVIERAKICNYKLIELSQAEENPVINITDDVLMYNPKNVEDGDGDKQNKDAALGEQNKETAYLDPDQEHELLEYWGPAPVWMVDPSAYGDDKRKYERVYAWFWLIDGQHVVRRQITPWRDAEPPYSKGVYIRVPGQFDGIGPLELNHGIQIEVNEQVNTRQDEINLKLNSPIAFNKDMVDPADVSRLVNGPGATWGFRGTDDIRKAVTTINYDANMADSWTATQFLLNESQEVTAAVKANVGTDGGGGAGEAGTFRGQLLNRQSASERFIMYARVYEATGLGQAVRKLYHRIYQFKSLDSIQRILGPARMQTFKFVAPEELNDMAKLVPLGVTSMENKGVQLAQMLEEFKTFIQFPWYKGVEAARKIVIQRGQSDPDQIIMSDEEAQAFNEQRRQLYEQQGIPMGGPGGEPQSGPPPSGPQPGPVAGNVPGPTNGLPQPAAPAAGPGASPIDLTGRPLS